MKRLLSLAHLTVLDADPVTLVEAGAAGGFDAIGLRIVAPLPGDSIVPVIGDLPLQRRIKERLSATGLHVLDAFVSMLGPVDQVYARLHSREIGPPPIDTAVVALDFANGITGTLATVRATPAYWRLHAFGSQGSAEALGENELVLRMTGKPAERRELPPVDSLRLVLEAFADAAAGRAPYPITPEQMLATMAAFELSIRSIAGDRPLSAE